VSGKLIYEGKAKQVIRGASEAEVIQVFKDSLTAFNGKKYAEVNGKGAINCEISSLLFQYLTDKGVKNHFVKFEAPNRMTIKKLKMIPLEVVIRNTVAGSLSKRFDLLKGGRLENPLFEMYYKADRLGDPFVSTEQAICFGWSNAEEIKRLTNVSFKINEILQKLFLAAGIDLVDFKLEFGKQGSDIYLGDEISPDTCRLWDISTKQVLDKDVFREDLGDVLVAYSEVLKRLKKVLTSA